MSKRITPAVIAPPALRADAPPPLWDHQADAVAAIHAGVARQQVCMACGTGKTVTGQHATLTFLQGRPGAILILTPTLALLKQTFDSWKLNAPFAFRAIAVCSTLTTAEKREAGAAEDIAVADLPLPATVDADVLTEFITANTDDVRVVFGTYQSLGVIIDAHAPDPKNKNKNKQLLPQWDAVLCDEAHRTAGDRTKKFGRVLHDDYVPAVHRLFLTATPKVHDISKGNGALLASMDDPELYGKRVYTITVKDAVELGILSEYQVAVIGVLDSELDKAHAAIGHATVDGQKLSMDHLATIVALSKAARERDLHAVIAFFNSIAASKEFIAAFNTVHAALGEGTAEHIDGHMTLSVRDEALARLAAKRSNGFHLVSNARCLSEGIDVPVLDAVVFGEPRGSQIDVVQCVGRAIRLNPRTDAPALIILAVRIGIGDDPDAAVEKSNFKKVRQVIAALEDHDPRIVEAMKVLVRDFGSDTESDESGDEADVDDPDTWVGDDAVDPFVESMQPLVRDSDTDKESDESGDDVDADDPDTWDGDDAADPAAVVDGVVVPVDDRTPPPAGEKRSGGVVVPGTAEWAKQLISLDIPKRLLTNGFALRILDISDRSFEEGLAEVRAYVAEHGHANVPQSYVSPDGHRTGQWVGKCRVYYAAGTLSADRVAELESIPGWVWSTLDEKWSTGMAAVRGYAAENGHARVPDSYKSPDGHKTGTWVCSRRQDYAAGGLTPDQIADLEAIPGWVWSMHNEQWATGLAAVTTYADQNGHARVPTSYVSPDGHRTGNWVGARRRDYRAGIISADRITELEAIPGWVWNPRDEQWLNEMAAVHAYVAANGHARVPQSYVSPDGHRTGQWVGVRRRLYAAGTLSTDQIAELEALPGWVWNQLEEQWATGVAAVRDYASSNGHVRIPAKYVSPDGHRTGSWVNSRRGEYAAEKLSPDRIAELESIPGWVWVALDDSRWASGTGAVRAYVAANGHANVPQNYVSPDGHRTGQWVRKRRGDYFAGTLNADRIAELESIPGWVWVALDDSWWVSGLAAVRGYVAANGHARVPDSYVSPGGHRTGNWVGARRRDYRAGILSADRITDLEAIPGWVWNPRDEKWSAGVAAVRAYASANGHANVPQNYVSPDGHRTGQWVGNRRWYYAAGTLSADRVAELESIPGWVWRAI